MYLIFWWVACLCAQQSSVEGIAVNKYGGAPLAGVHVRLIGFNMDGPRAVFGAISDKTGHFSVSGMSAGTYLLVPEYPGFLYVPPKSESPLPGMQIKPGEKIQDYRLEMSPRSVLSGRVVDEYGDPMAHVIVLCTAADPKDEMLNMFGAQRPQTDDRGEFRFSMAPGKYYLKAESYESSNELPEIRTDGTIEAVYGPTYYPNAAAKDRAAVIEAKPGVDVTGLEIRLARLPNLTISGIVTGMPDGHGNVQITARYGENTQMLNGSRSVQAGRDGRFSLSRLTPGLYRVFARYASSGQPMQSASVDVRLDGADQTNIELSLSGGGEVSGTLQLAGLPDAKRSVRLQPAEASNYWVTLPAPAAVDSEGAFKMLNVSPGRYRVVVEPLPANGYVKSVQLDGAAAPDGIIDLSSGARGSRLKVLASTGAGQISGKVLDKDGQPIANSMAFAFLLESPKTVGEESTIRVSSDGSFEKKGIRPGKYRIFALDLFHYIGSRSALTNDFSEPFARGEEIEVKEGDKIVKDLKVLEKEEAHDK
jgi:hypothetical protein